MDYRQKRGSSLAALKTDLAAFEEINQPTRRCHLGNECEIFSTKRSEDLNPILSNPINIDHLTDQEMAASVELPHLVAHVGATVHDSRANLQNQEESSEFQRRVLSVSDFAAGVNTHPGTVAELPGLLEDLSGQLSSGREHQGERELRKTINWSS